MNNYLIFNLLCIFSMLSALNGMNQSNSITPPHMPLTISNLNRATDNGETVNLLNNSNPLHKAQSQLKLQKRDRLFFCICSALLIGDAILNGALKCPDNDNTQSSTCVAGIAFPLFISYIPGFAAILKGSDIEKTKKLITQLEQQTTMSSFCSNRDGLIKPRFLCYTSIIQL